MANTNEEFQAAFEAARDRLESNRMEFNHIFVCSGPHPAYPGLLAVVWCSPQGEISIDALSADQVMPIPVINRNESTKERGDRFRDWYIERKS